MSRDFPEDICVC